jgi:hypothetical protein
METIIRIKRKRNEDPLDALLVHSEKKFKHHVYKWVESIDQQSIELVREVDVAFSCQILKKESTQANSIISGRAKGSSFYSKAKESAGRSVQGCE